MTPSKTRLALIGMSAKPFHRGHSELVRIAAKECRSVFLFVSTSNRARKGEVPILGRDMAYLLQVAIVPYLPRNVLVEYGGSPISKVWEYLGRHDRDLVGRPEILHDTCVLYGDPDDLGEAYPQQRLEKYCGNLLKDGKVILRAVKRSETANVSGTQMRQWLDEGDKQSFVANLPEVCLHDVVWNKLRETAVAPLKVKTTAKARRTKAD